MTTGRGFKRESTINGGLMTPSDSFVFAPRSTLTPMKRDESIDLTSIDDCEDPHLTTELRNTQHGLPTVARFSHRQMRSESGNSNRSDLCTCTDI